MTFQDYFATLERSCDSTGEPQPGILVWTPDENTPDIVYYQVSVCMYNVKQYGVKCSFLA